MISIELLEERYKETSTEGKREARFVKTLNEILLNSARTRKGLWGAAGKTAGRFWYRGPYEQLEKVMGMTYKNVRTVVSYLKKRGDLLVIKPSERGEANAYSLSDEVLDYYFGTREKITAMPIRAG